VCTVAPSAKLISKFLLQLSGPAPCQIYDGRFVSVGTLVLFSTDSGDAWLLDPAERLATRLARNGEPDAIHIEETDTNFAVAWAGHYRIDGAAFLYNDHGSDRVATILGYPTDRIAQLG